MVYFHTSVDGAAQELKDWLADRRVKEAKIPAGYTSRRPNDQQMYNVSFH